MSRPCSTCAAPLASSHWNARFCAPCRPSRSPRKRRRAQRRYRRRHVAEGRAYRDRTLPARLAREAARRKLRVGRVCASCDRTDADVSWSGSRAAYCSSCDRRGQEHGFCPRCRAARYADPLRARCRCPSPLRAAARARLAAVSSSFATLRALLTLWDRLRWSDAREAPARDFAALLGLGPRATCPGRFGPLARVLRGLDPGFAADRGIVKWTGDLPRALERRSEDLALALGRGDEEEP